MKILPFVLIVLSILCAACSNKISQNKEIENTPKEQDIAVISQKKITVVTWMT